MTESLFRHERLLPLQSRGTDGGRAGNLQAAGGYLGAGGNRPPEIKCGSAARPKRARHHAAAAALARHGAQQLLWYRQPAAKMGRIPARRQWPAGGRCLRRAGAASEYELNEQTIWTGGPYDPTRPGGPEALPEIRRLVFAGKYVEAEELFGKTMLGKPVEQMKYQPLGNLVSRFPRPSQATDYRRELDLDTAIAKLSLSRERREFSPRGFRPAPSTR